MRVKMKGGNRSEEKRFIVKKLEDGHQRNVTRKRREKWQITIKKRKWGKKKYEPDLCNAMRVPKIVRSPFYMFAPLTSDDSSQFPHPSCMFDHWSR